MQLTPEDAPNEWLGDNGEKVTDNIQAVFLYEGKPEIYLCCREFSLGFSSMAPIAILGDASVWLISEGKIIGLFNREVCLVLEDENRKPLALKIPFKALTKESRENLPKFLDWVNKNSDVFSRFRGNPNFSSPLFLKGLRASK